MKDIKLKNYRTVYYFRYLNWDSQFFSKKTYLLDSEKSKLKPDKAIAKLIQQIFKDSFITVKLDSPYDKMLICFLQKNGFLYIDTEIVLRYSHSVMGEQNFNRHISVFELKKNERLPYKELGSSFLYSRFHSDVRIPKDKANQLWIDYLKNFNPSNRHRIFIAKYDNKIAGVILVNENKNKKMACLFYVAIMKRFQNKGIGSNLIRYVVKQFPRYALYTETQMKNTAAVNFYIKNGFSVIKNTKVVMHRWS